MSTPSEATGYFLVEYFLPQIISCGGYSDVLSIRYAGSGLGWPSRSVYTTMANSRGGHTPAEQVADLPQIQSYCELCTG